mgnify:CR=1 FL=1
MNNLLKNEKSPYLKQHENNPVHWYPWGKEAFKAAKTQNKPIFLSIGYSTCHWCHVMEKESFENEEIAVFLNLNFICIKVDREELPDVDQIYMEAVQAMTGKGGWPMTAILNPNKIPFFGGTYFTKDELLEILKTLSSAWKKQPKKIALIGKQVRIFLESSESLIIKSIDLDESIFRIAYKKFLTLYDKEYFGFGIAPKFPPITKLSLLTRIARRTKDEFSKEMENLIQLKDDEFKEKIEKKFIEKRNERIKYLGEDQSQEIEKRILLQTIDLNWKSHIQYLENLRQVVSLRGYAQRDPLVEYKKEAFNLFENLLNKLKTDLITVLINLAIVEKPVKKPNEKNKPVKNIPNLAGKKMRRNEPCFCGSGKKYKYCCGAL